MLHNEWNITVFYVPWGHFYSLALGFQLIAIFWSRNMCQLNIYIGIEYIRPTSNDTDVESAQWELKWQT